MKKFSPKINKKFKSLKQNYNMINWMSKIKMDSLTKKRQKWKKNTKAHQKKVVVMFTWKNKNSGNKKEWSRNKIKERLLNQNRRYIAHHQKITNDQFNNKAVDFLLIFAQEMEIK